MTGCATVVMVRETHAEFAATIVLMLEVPTVVVDKVDTFGTIPCVIALPNVWFCDRPIKKLAPARRIPAIVIKILFMDFFILVRGSYPHLQLSFRKARVRTRASA